MKVKPQEKTNTAAPSTVTIQQTTSKSEVSSKNSSMKRTKTGIPGFDDLIQGGFPSPSNILIEGKPGTGKTIFAMEYLYNGATQFNEPGLYLSFEQSAASIYSQAAQFGWDFEKAGVSVVYRSPSKVKSVSEIIKIIFDQAGKNGIRRIVVDSLPALYINAKDVTIEKSEGFFSRLFGKDKVKELDEKKFIYLFLDTIKCVPLTTLIVTEDINSLQDFGDTPEYAADGVIKLTLEPMGQFSRSMLITKMRHTKNNTNSQPVEINDKGITIHTQQE